MLPDLKSLLPTTTTTAAPTAGAAPAAAPGAQAFANSLNAPATTDNDASGSGNSNAATAVQTLPQPAVQTASNYETQAADAAESNLSAELASLSETTTAKLFVSGGSKFVRFDESHQAGAATSLPGFADQGSTNAQAQQFPLVLDSLRDDTETTDAAALPQSAATFLTAVSANIPLQLPSLDEPSVEDIQPAATLVDSSASAEATTPTAPSTPATSASGDLRPLTIDIAQAVLPSLQDLPPNPTNTSALNTAIESPFVTTDVAPSELLTDVASKPNDVAPQASAVALIAATPASPATEPSPTLPTPAVTDQANDQQNKIASLETPKTSPTANTAPTVAPSTPQVKKPATIATTSDEAATSQPVTGVNSESAVEVDPDVNSTVAGNSGDDTTASSAKLPAQPQSTTKTSAKPEAEKKAPAPQPANGLHPLLKSKFSSQSAPVSPAQPSSKQPPVPQTAAVTQQAAAIAQATVAPVTTDQTDDAAPADAGDESTDQTLSDTSARTLTPLVHAAPHAAALQAADSASTPSGGQPPTIAAVGSKAVDGAKSDTTTKTIEPIADAVATNFASAPTGNSTTVHTTQFRAEARDSQPAHLGHQVLTAIQKAADEGSHLRMQLTPPSLGSLIVDVSRTENGIVARLEFSNPAAQQAALQNLPDLQQTLAQQGIKVDRIEIRSQDINQQQAGRGRDDQAREGAQQRQDRRQEQPRQQSQQTEEEDDENLAA